MDRRKDTPTEITSKLPSEYIEMITDVFNKNFKSSLEKDEKFIVFGFLYHDEVLLSVSLKNEKYNRTISTCYASIDFPPPQFKNEEGKLKGSSFEAVQTCVNLCVDSTASFFTQFFEENRPLDYDEEYRQNWTPIQIDEKNLVYLKINRDNVELELMANDFLKQHGYSETAKKIEKTKK
jgi:hypothetical protein